MMKLSIIVCVYNEKRFLRRCLESLSLLNVDDYEVILIDDGSTDGSAKMCDAFENSFEHIKILHTENRGLVSARDSGLAIATGKYISFVDSDDWVDADFYSEFINIMDNNPKIDVCIGGVKRSWLGADTILFEGNTEVLSSADAFRRMTQKEGMHWYLCGKLYRRELFSGIEVNPMVTVYEDLDRNWKLFSKARNVFFCSYYFYHYYLNDRGMTVLSTKPNRESWRVFRSILFSGCHDKKLLIKIMEYYVKTYIRYTWELYFFREADFSNLICEYIKEFNDTISNTTTPIKTIYGIPNQSVLFSYNLLINFYDSINDDMKMIAETAFRRDKAVYVYGAGVQAQYLSLIMRDKHLSCNAYVVSDGQAKRSFINNVPVRYVSEVNFHDESACIILTVPYMARLSVKNTLKAKGNVDLFELTFPDITF